LEEVEQRARSQSRFADDGAVQVQGLRTDVSRLCLDERRDPNGREDLGEVLDRVAEMALAIADVAAERDGDPYRPASRLPVRADW
jgi:hypothetical protein